MPRLTVLAGFAGWLAGFAVAVTTTLLLNRAFTFRQASHHGPWRQAVIYLAVQGAGAGANFATYAAAIAIFPALERMLLIPLAMGSIAGLCLTFLGSKHIAFKPAVGRPAEAALVELSPHDAPELTVQRAD